MIVLMEEGHTGCVNSVNWNHNGDLLVSGSDDTRVIIWDVFGRKIQQAIHSGHVANIFWLGLCFMLILARSLCLISCSADTDIRVIDRMNDEKKVFSCHHGRVKKLAYEQMNPHFFMSVGEVY